MTTLTQQRIEELQVRRQAIDLTHPEETGFRHHLGASQIGDNCSRKLWFNFRHSKKVIHDARMVRLFNRGHAEEDRFIKMLESIGVTYFPTDPNTGKQYRLSHADGHFGGSCDGIGIGFPECPDEYVLGEFKTHGDKSFTDLIKKGVKLAKPLHYDQIVTYLFKGGFKKCFYMAVNKNTDELYTEWIYADDERAKYLLAKAEAIIHGEHVPDRVSESSAYFECRWCDYRALCFHKGVAEPHKSCRSCQYSKPAEGGTWFCNYSNTPDIDTVNPCSAYTKHVVFVKPNEVKLGLTLGPAKAWYYHEGSDSYAELTDAEAEASCGNGPLDKIGTLADVEAHKKALSNA